MSAASRSTRCRDSLIDAPRALLNAMVWLIGRHNQGFHLAALGVAFGLGKAGVAVMVDMGMTSDFLQPLRRRVPEEGFRNG
jgi:hypothetical protein